MDCSEFFRMLDNYSSLNSAQLAELEAHAAKCDKCRDELEFFKQITKTAASLKAPSPPSDLADRINAKIDKLPEPSFIRSAASSVKRNIRQYATAAACLVLGIVVGINGKMMNERISGHDNDGLISSTVSESRSGFVPDTTTPSPETSSETAVSADAAVSETVTETAQPAPGRISQPTSRPASGTVAADPVRNDVPSSDTDTQRANTAPVQNNTQSGSSGRIIAPANAFTSSAGAQQGTPSEIPAEVENTPVALQTETESMSDQVPETEENNDYSGTDAYTLEHESYHLPDENTSALPTEESSSETEVENYALSDDTQTEYGYNAADVEPGRLAVYSEDSDKFLEIMSGFSVESSSEGNRMESGQFYSFLDSLDAAGINYSYIERGSSGDYVMFIVVLL